MPEDVDRNFKDVVSRLEGAFKKGAYSKWLTRALMDFIKSHNIQQQSAKNLQFVQPAVKEIRRTRELMQMIIKNISWDKGMEINRGSGLPDKFVRDAIIKIRNLDPRDPRTASKWISRLVDHDFIRRKSYNIWEVLDTGQDWNELEPMKNEKPDEAMDETIKEFV